MKSNFKRICSAFLSLAVAAGIVLAEAPASEAAAKLSVPKKVSVNVGKAKTMKIKASGYTVKKVKCVSEAQNVKIKTTKKAITITAKKGTEGQSDYLVTTVTAKKGSKTQDYTFYTSVTIKGTPKKTTKHISSLADLKAIDGSNANVKYVIDNDIDMTGWTEPIKYVKCSIDGNGHTLSNLSVPFLGKVYGATIENLTFGLNIKSVYELADDEKYLAPICYIGPGEKSEIATVSNCKATGSISFQGSVETPYKPVYAGGIVGENPNDYGLVKNCFNSASITVKGDLMAAVGGVIGYADGRSGNVNVKECENIGAIEAEVHDYYNVGVGGVVGYGSSYAIAKDCLNAGSVTAVISGNQGKDAAGGILGGGDYCLENCVSAGKADFAVFGSKIDKMLLDSWASSAVMYKNVYYSAAIENGFDWLEGPVEVSGVNKVSDMTDKSAFAGLDFDKVWKMGEKGPQLRNIP